MLLEKVLTRHQDRKQNKTLDSLILSRGVRKGRVRGTDYTSSDPDVLLTGRFPIVLAGKCTEKHSYDTVTHGPIENSLHAPNSHFNPAVSERSQQACRR